MMPAESAVDTDVARSGMRGSLRPFIAGIEVGNWVGPDLVPKEW